MDETLTEEIDRPESSRYFSEKFVDEAPVNEGPDALMVWLDNNMGEEIKQQVGARREFLPPEKEINPTVWEDLVYSHEQLSKAYSQLLIRYAGNLHEMAMLNDSDKIAREKKAREKVPWLYENKRPWTVERLKDRQVPLLELINALQLQPEKKVIDSLFEQANSIPGNHLVEKA